MYDFEKFRKAYEAGEEISPRTGATVQEYRAFRTYSMTREGVGFGRVTQSHDAAVAEVEKFHK